MKRCRSIGSKGNAVGKGEGRTKVGRIAGKWREIYLGDGEITWRIFSRAKEHGGTPPCELVSLLILISYRNPFPYKRGGASQ